MNNFCTLFDKNYLARGLAMYESLKKHSANFHLYIFAFDDFTYNFFKKEKLDFITVVSLEQFEDEKLLKLKPTRTAGEYCWTCTPSIIGYSIQNYNLDSCTYLDADLYFFSNPDILIKEMGSNSVLITEHRYTPKYDQSDTSGKYCVQFMTFKNDANGTKVLDWWTNACNEWCYDRKEDGKFGDQKYLDDWKTRFDGVYELQHLGGGVAPWNIQQYDFVAKADNGDKIYGIEKKTKKEFELVFYHFHGLKLLANNKVKLMPDYASSKQVRNLIYKPYIKHLVANEKQHIPSSSNLAKKKNNIWYFVGKILKNPFLIVKIPKRIMLERCNTKSLKNFLRD